MNWNATVEYQINAKNLLKVFYQGSAGVGLAESWNINAFPTSFGQGDPALQQAAFAATQNYLPYPQFEASTFCRIWPFDLSCGDGAVPEAVSRTGWCSTRSTRSRKCWTTATPTMACVPGVEPVTNRSLNKGRAGFDMNHRWVASFTYEVPIGKGRRFLNRGGILNFLIGGYEVAWIQTAESGKPGGLHLREQPE